MGSKSGNIYLYNLQSGLSRGSLPFSSQSGHGLGLKDTVRELRTATPGNVLHELKKAVGEDLSTKNKNSSQKAKEVEKEVGHTLDVTGLFFNNTGSVLVSCSMDSNLIFWDFYEQKLIRKISHNCAQLKLFGFRDGNFVAVVGQDKVIRLYDIASFKISRRFAGHIREITDVGFSPDGRRLISSSLDSTLRVWDIPTGRCLSWVSFTSPVISLAVSLSGEYLSLSFIDKEGIFMYVDRSLYETVYFSKEPDAPTAIMDSLVKVDSNSTEYSDEIEDLAHDNQPHIEIIPSQAQVEKELPREPITQKSKNLVTLSSLPKAFWTSLFRLEEIKQRNLPIEAPKKPANAPFFLPTVHKGGAEQSFPTFEEYNKIQNSENTTDTVERVNDSLKENDKEEEAMLRSVWRTDNNEENLLTADDTHSKNKRHKSKISKNITMPRFNFN